MINGGRVGGDSGPRFSRALLQPVSVPLVIIVGPDGEICSLSLGYA